MWTKEKPTKPGLYAWRHNSKVHRELAQVSTRAGILVVYFTHDSLNSQEFVLSKVQGREWLRIPE